MGSKGNSVKYFWGISVKTDIWMPFYIGDYKGKTSRLSTEEHGAYVLLLLDYWMNGSLPNDDEMLARITLLSAKKWKKIRRKIESFFILEGDKLVHSELNALKEKSLKNKNIAIEKSKKGNAARWNKESHKESSKESLKDSSKDRSSSSSSYNKKEKIYKKEKVKKTATPLPADLVLTAEMAAYAREKSVPNPAAEFEAFKNWALSTGATYVDWAAGWRTRCLNYLRFNPTRAGPAPPNTPTESAAWHVNLGAEYAQEFGDEQKKCN